MKLSVIRDTLAQLQLRPAKSLGQNFLHDQNLARWLVERLEVQPGDHLVEIGPGLGALTEHALRTGASLTAIEKDRRLAGHLRERYADALASGQLTLHHGDATEFDPRRLWPRQPVKVFGALPYYVSTPLLFRFTAPSAPADRLLFVMQLELAERLAAGPGSRDVGVLSVVVQRRWEVRLVRRLPAQVFLPAPKVSSGAVLLTPRPAATLPPCDEPTFDRLVRAGFSQRRKQLGNLLTPVLAELGRTDLDWPGLARSVDLPAAARAEEVDLARWVALANLVTPVAAPQAQDPAAEWFDVVDERDRVVDRRTRAEVHARDLRHRAVHVFVLNNRGDELFLQKRSRWKDRHPGVWDSSAAGHLLPGEPYAAAARRELAEELGLRPGPASPGDDGPEEVATLPPAPGTGWEFIRLFVAHSDGPFRWPAAEIEWGGFFPLDLIEQWTAARPQDFAPGFLACWARWRAGSGTAGGGVPAPAA